jgi:hypothetical protein
VTWSTTAAIRRGEQFMMPAAERFSRKIERALCRAATTAPGRRSSPDDCERLPRRATIRSMMTGLTFVLILVLLIAVLEPLAKGIARRIGNTSDDSAELNRLRSLLEETDVRLQDAERRLRDAEQRLDFQERLLSSRSSTTGES